MDVAVARERLLQFFEPVGIENVPLELAPGRVLAVSVRARSDYPPFTNSSMDGFAARAADVAIAGNDQPVKLKVVADIPAGVFSPVRLAEGQAARIMTGAPAPEGADVVIPVEDTDLDRQPAGTPAPDAVRVYRGYPAGAFLRPAGQDIQAGEVVLESGLRLRPQEIGFLAMLGTGTVQVHRRPRVAVFSSGDELVPVGQDLGPGQIHDANQYTLVAAVERAGGEPLFLGILPDDEGAIIAALERAVEADVDLILSSAGVSVGAFDYVRSAIESNGRLDFWRVNMRPGKPLAFGHYRGKPLIGLPGNPVSAFVGYEVFVRPALEKLAGARPTNRQVTQVELDEAIESDGRESYLRAVLYPQDGRLRARLTGHQGSGNLRSLVQANGLLVIPAGVENLPVGATVLAWFI